MNRTELAKLVAEDVNLYAKDADNVLKVCFDTIGDAVAEGHKVVIPGFGVFEPSVRPARKGRNPSTGEEITIAAKTVMKFKQSSALKEKVKG